MPWLPPCSVDPDLFFDGDLPSHSDACEAAKRACSDCPIRKACLQEALPYPDLDGIWGATTKAERAHLRRRLRIEPMKLPHQIRPADPPRKAA